MAWTSQRPLRSTSVMTVTSMTRERSTKNGSVCSGWTRGQNTNLVNLEYDPWRLGWASVGEPRQFGI